LFFLENPIKSFFSWGNVIHKVKRSDWSVLKSSVATISRDSRYSM